MLRVRIEAPLRPTEDPDKIVTAIRKLFPDATIDIGTDRIIGTTETLERLRQRIRDQRIRDTARRQLSAGRTGERTTVGLSKQAAFMGIVNFAASSPLGDLRVEIESDDLASVIDYVAESTLAPKA